jgi:hypothetical protein
VTLGDALHDSILPLPACSRRFLFINLDSYDVSALGSPEGTPERALAER